MIEDPETGDRIGVESAYSVRNAIRLPSNAAWEVGTSATPTSWAPTTPYDKLKCALRADIDEAAWASLNSTISRPFPRPTSGRTVDHPVVRTFLPSVHQVNVGSRIRLVWLPNGSYPRSAGPTSREDRAWIRT